MALPEVLTPEQVADYLQLDKETIYRLIRARRLAATRIGRTYRIPREDLEIFLRANSTRGEVRKAAWDRVLAYAERENPKGDSDSILDWLERQDEDHARRASAT